LVDEPCVGVLGAVGPPLGAGPALAGDIAGGDIVEVVQLVDAGLLPPHGPAEVLLVAQDRPDGGVRPAARVTVLVPGAIVRRRRGDVLGGKGVGDLLEPLSGGERLEDAPHHRSGYGVGLEAVEPLAERPLLGVGVLAGVGEPVPVGRSTAEVALPGLGQHGHAVPDASADQVPLLLRGAPEHPEEHLGGGRAVVDPAADLGQPQLDAEVLEQRVDRRVLDGRSERPGELADHDRVPRVGTGPQFGQQAPGLGPADPWQRPGVADVEVLGHDLRARRQDAARLGELAGPGCLGLLHLLGRHPTDEREAQIAHGLTSTAPSGRTAPP
jgi:hypothetical protein